MCEREPHLALSFVVVCGELKQEADQLLTCGMREANGSHLRDRRMIDFTELLRDAQCYFSVRAQKEQEILARDEIGLSRFNTSAVSS